MAIYQDINDEMYRNSKTLDVWTDEDIEVIKTSIRNILMTVKGSRRMLPMFGANLDSLLFEPMDQRTAKRIGNLILSEIEKWETRVNITKVQVIGDQDKSQYDVNIFFNVKTASINTGSVSFVLQQR